MCTCSEFDWIGIDQTLAHHPDCHRPNEMTPTAFEFSLGPVNQMETFELSLDSHTKESCLQRFNDHLHFNAFTPAECQCVKLLPLLLETMGAIHALQEEIQQLKGNLAVKALREIQANK